MAKKHEYSICTIQHFKWNSTLDYVYDRVSVQLLISKNDFCIHMYRPKMYTPESLMEDRTLRDAMKKALLLQLVQYGRCSRLKELLVTVDDETTVIKFGEGEQLVYLLCGDRLLFPFNSSWNDSRIIDTIIHSKKSDYSRLHTSLFAFMVAQSKLYEVEQFLYLWMAMNGLYGHIAEKVKTVFSNGDKWIKKEWAQLKFFSLVLGVPYRSINQGNTIAEKKENNNLRFSLERILSSVPNHETDSFIEACIKNDTTNQWVLEIHNLLKNHSAENDIHPYMLLLLWLPYQVRCTYFHGEFSVPLLCFKDEYPLPALHIINNVLRNFLNANLSHWFIDEGQDEIIKAIASSCTFEKDNRLKKCDVFQQVSIKIY